MFQFLRKSYVLAAVVLMTIIASCSKEDHPDLKIEGTYLGKAMVEQVWYDEYYVHVDRLSENKIRVYTASTPTQGYFDVPINQTGNSLQSADTTVKLGYFPKDTDSLSFHKSNQFSFLGSKVN